eukprot:TRINITY_DN3314_c1_g1_i23.p1 TRINITY_DN3314_c1_g1~~TRINITY_DN3314_c1_g1_i23.p1  ORF type:complete len:2923 (-),score=769.42 TRINITY_DN3314_c1_g1_i23:131-8899(-)
MDDLRRLVGFWTCQQHKAYEVKLTGRDCGVVHCSYPGTHWEVNVAVRGSSVVWLGKYLQYECGFDRRGNVVWTSRIGKKFTWWPSDGPAIGLPKRGLLNTRGGAAQPAASAPAPSMRPSIPKGSSPSGPPPQGWAGVRHEPPARVPGQAPEPPKAAAKAPWAKSALAALSAANAANSKPKASAARPSAWDYEGGEAAPDPPSDDESASAAATSRPAVAGIAPIPKKAPPPLPAKGPPAPPPPRKSSAEVTEEWPSWEEEEAKMEQETRENKTKEEWPSWEEEEEAMRTAESSAPRAQWASWEEEAEAKLALAEERQQEAVEVGTSDPLPRRAAYGPAPTGLAPAAPPTPKTSPITAASPPPSIFAPPKTASAPPPPPPRPVKPPPPLTPMRSALAAAAAVQQFPAPAVKQPPATKQPPGVQVSSIQPQSGGPSLPTPPPKAAPSMVETAADPHGVLHTAAAASSARSSPQTTPKVKAAPKNLAALSPLPPLAFEPAADAKAPPPDVAAAVAKTNQMRPPPPPVPRKAAPEASAKPPAVKGPPLKAAFSEEVREAAASPPQAEVTMKLPPPSKGPPPELHSSTGVTLDSPEEAPAAATKAPPPGIAACDPPQAKLPPPGVAFPDAPKAKTARPPPPPPPPKAKRPTSPVTAAAVTPNPATDGDKEIEGVWGIPLPRKSSPPVAAPPATTRKPPPPHLNGVLMPKAKTAISGMRNPPPTMPPLAGFVVDCPPAPVPLASQALSADPAQEEARADAARTTHWSCKVTVGNLPSPTKEEELRAHMAQAGQVLWMNISRWRQSAEVAFASAEQAEFAAELLHGALFKGKAIAVEKSVPKWQADEDDDIPPPPARPPVHPKLQAFDDDDDIPPPPLNPPTPPSSKAAKPAPAMYAAPPPPPSKATPPPPPGWRGLGASQAPSPPPPPPARPPASQAASRTGQALPGPWAASAAAAAQRWRTRVEGTAVADTISKADEEWPTWEEELARQEKAEEEAAREKRRLQEWLTPDPPAKAPPSPSPAYYPDASSSVPVPVPEDTHASNTAACSKQPPPAEQEPSRTAGSSTEKFGAGPTVPGRWSRPSEREAPPPPAPTETAKASARQRQQVMQRDEMINLSANLSASAPEFVPQAAEGTKQTAVAPPAKKKGIQAKNSKLARKKTTAGKEPASSTQGVEDSGAAQGVDEGAAVEAAEESESDAFSDACSSRSGTSEERRQPRRQGRERRGQASADEGHAEAGSQRRRLRSPETLVGLFESELKAMASSSPTQQAGAAAAAAAATTSTSPAAAEAPSESKRESAEEREKASSISHSQLRPDAPEFTLRPEAPEFKPCTPQASPATAPQAPPVSADELSDAGESHADQQEQQQEYSQTQRAQQEGDQQDDVFLWPTPKGPALLSNRQEPCPSGSQYQAGMQRVQDVAAEYWQYRQANQNAMWPTPAGQAQGQGGYYVVGYGGYMPAQGTGNTQGYGYPAYQMPQVQQLPYATAGQGAGAQQHAAATQQAYNRQIRVTSGGDSGQVSPTEKLQIQDREGNKMALMAIELLRWQGPLPLIGAGDMWVPITSVEWADQPTVEVGAAAAAAAATVSGETAAVSEGRQDQSDANAWMISTEGSHDQPMWWTANGASTLVARLEQTNTDIRQALMSALAADPKLLWRMSVHKHGCRVVKKALEMAGDVSEQAVIAEHLRGHVLEAVISAHANHVLQQSIVLLPPNRLGFVLEELEGRGAVLAKHPFGSCVIQRIIENWPPASVERLLSEILPSSANLAKHPSGCNVVQHILEHGTWPQRERVIDELAKQARALALHPSAKMVLDNAFRYCSEENRRKLMAAINSDSQEQAASEEGRRTGQEEDEQRAIAAFRSGPSSGAAWKAAAAAAIAEASSTTAAPNAEAAPTSSSSPAAAAVAEGVTDPEQHDLNPLASAGNLVSAAMQRMEGYDFCCLHSNPHLEIPEYDFIIDAPWISKAELMSVVEAELPLKVEMEFQDSMYSQPTNSSGSLLPKLFEMVVTIERDVTEDSLIVILMMQNKRTFKFESHIKIKARIQTDQESGEADPSSVAEAGVNGLSTYRIDDSSEGDEAAAAAEIADEEDDSAFTTVMLRNIPYKYTRQLLVDRLYDLGFKGEIDYLYLAADIGTQCNRGYGFINFRSSIARYHFSQLCNDVPTESVLPGFQSRKVCQVGRAKWQGAEENKRQLSRSDLLDQLAAYPEWLPVLFDESGEQELFSPSSAAPAEENMMEDVDCPQADSSRHQSDAEPEQSSKADSSWHQSDAEPEQPSKADSSRHQSDAEPEQSSKADSSRHQSDAEPEQSSKADSSRHQSDAEPEQSSKADSSPSQDVASVLEVGDEALPEAEGSPSQDVVSVSEALSEAGSSPSEDVASVSEPLPEAESRPSQDLISVSEPLPEAKQSACSSAAAAAAGPEERKNKRKKRTRGEEEPIGEAPQPAEGTIADDGTTDDAAAACPELRFKLKVYSFIRAQRAEVARETSEQMEDIVAAFSRGELQTDGHMPPLIPFEGLMQLEWSELLHLAGHVRRRWMTAFGRAKKKPPKLTEKDRLKAAAQMNAIEKAVRIAKEKDPGERRREAKLPPLTESAKESLRTTMDGLPDAQLEIVLGWMLAIKKKVDFDSGEDIRPHFDFDLDELTAEQQWDLVKFVHELVKSDKAQTPPTSPVAKAKQSACSSAAVSAAGPEERKNKKKKRAREEEEPIGEAHQPAEAKVETSKAADVEEEPGVEKSQPVETEAPKHAAAPSEQSTAAHESSPQQLLAAAGVALAARARHQEAQAQATEDTSNAAAAVAAAVEPERDPVAAHTEAEQPLAQAPVISSAAAAAEAAGDDQDPDAAHVEAEQPLEEALPPGWTAYTSDEGCIWYWHEATQQMSWEPPTWEPPLAEGWQEYVDPNCGRWYYHEATDAYTLERPVAEAEEEVRSSL